MPNGNPKIIDFIDYYWTGSGVLPSGSDGSDFRSSQRLVRPVRVADRKKNKKKPREYD